MRGMEMPRSKKLYIMQDAKREAERLGIAFGRICDPLGPGIERCLAAFAVAHQPGVPTCLQLPRAASAGRMTPASVSS
jgi:2-hydroxychromene-2-carboxylate isomerase